MHFCSDLRILMQSKRCKKQTDVTRPARLSWVQAWLQVQMLVHVDVPHDHQLKLLTNRHAYSMMTWSIHLSS